jgi:hypothetical protein
MMANKFKKGMKRKVESMWVVSDQEIKDTKPLDFTFDLHGAMIKFKKKNPETLPKMTPVRLTGAEQPGSIKVTPKPIVKPEKLEVSEVLDKGKSQDRRVASPLSTHSKESDTIKITDSVWPRQSDAVDFNRDKQPNVDMLNIQGNF